MTRAGKSADPDHLRPDEKVYCWRVAPQQSPLPLQLSGAKIVIPPHLCKINVNLMLKLPPPIAPQHRRGAIYCARPGETYLFKWKCHYLRSLDGRPQYICARLSPLLEQISARAPAPAFLSKHRALARYSTRHAAHPLFGILIRASKSRH